MKWTRKELLNQGESGIEFDEIVQFDDKAFDKVSGLHQVKDVRVHGVGNLNSDNLFEVDVEIEGTMVCPCSITNELVEVPFETNSHEIFSFAPSDDVEIHVVKNEIVELIPIVFQLITLEVPLRVVKDGEINYPQGDGWRVLSEKEFEESRKDQIDPRLAKLKEFKTEKK